MLIILITTNYRGKILRTEFFHWWMMMTTPKCQLIGKTHKSRFIYPEHIFIGNIFLPKEMK
jgi:hypothetical protein